MPADCIRNLQRGEARRQEARARPEDQAPIEAGQLHPTYPLTPLSAAVSRPWTLNWELASNIGRARNAGTPSRKREYLLKTTY